MARISKETFCNVHKSATFKVLSLASVCIPLLNRPNVIAAVKKAASVLRNPKELILAVGKGVKVNKAGMRVIIVDATAEASLSKSEVSRRYSLSDGRQTMEAPTPYIPFPPKMALGESLSLYTASGGVKGGDRTSG